MIATGKTPGGILVPLNLNPFEYRRRFLQWQKHYRKQQALEALKDIDARRGSYAVRNYGIDKVLEMDKRSREEKMERKRQEAERIADMMAMEAARSLGSKIVF